MRGVRWEPVVSVRTADEADAAYHAFTAAMTDQWLRDQGLYRQAVALDAARKTARALTFDPHRLVRRPLGQVMPFRTPWGTQVGRIRWYKWSNIQHLSTRRAILSRALNRLRGARRAQ